MKYAKYIFLIALIIFKGYILNIVNNINGMLFDERESIDAEAQIIQNKYDDLYNEYTKLSDLKLYTNTKYSLTRISYRKNYNYNDFYIYGGKNKKFQKGDLLVNKEGLVGKITKVKDKYSEAKLITDINNISVKIGSIYATISDYKDNLFIISDISNYDKISLNDKVYTSTLGENKQSVYIGKVFKIENGIINKRVYIKSKVDFYDLDYLYVVGNI